MMRCRYGLPPCCSMQPRAQPVLVDAAGGGYPSFEVAKCGPEEAGLPKHALGAAIGLGYGLQASDHVALEILDCAPAPPELVVERQYLEDQSRAQAKWRRRAGLAGVTRCAADQHLALELGEQRWCVSSVLMETLRTDRRASECPAEPRPRPASRPAGFRACAGAPRRRPWSARAPRNRVLRADPP